MMTTSQMDQESEYSVTSGVISPISELLERERESTNSSTEDHILHRRSTRINEMDLKLAKEREERLLAKKQLQSESNNDQLTRQNYNEWDEPPLAKPTPTVTGLPLSSFPTKKIRKESLWPKKKTTKKSKKKNLPLQIKLENIDDEQNSTEFIDSDDELESQQLEPLKQRYYQNLQTGQSEKLTQYSIERVDDHFKLIPIKKNGSENFVKRKIKSTTNNNQIELVPSTPKKQNKLKKDEIKKRIKRTPKKNRGNAFGYGAADLSGIKRGGFDYDDPTRDNEDFCSACGGVGIFLCCEACPKSFHFICCDPPMDEDNLPEGNWYCNECLSKRRKVPQYHVGIFSKLLNQCEIRNPRKFELPKKLRESTFENVSTGPSGEYQDASVINNSKPIKVGKLEEIDPLNIYDKDGKPLLCYKCGLSGLEKPITKCGYCDLSWHLDCVSPPLPSVKTLGTKWKCPNHVLDLIPEKKRRYKKQNYVDVSMSRGFINNGDIEIIPDTEDSEDELDGDTEIVQLVTPNYFNSYYENGQVRAPIGEELEKIITMNNITYRIPEKGVILDFIDSSKIKKLSHIDESTREFVDTISEFHDQPTVDSDLSFKYLLNVLDREFNESINDITINDDEIDDLKYLKKLIELKGRDKLLEFLKC